MAFNPTFRAGFTGLSVILVAACSADTLSRGSFQGQYAQARNALETGEYNRARRAYKALLPKAGPFAPRVQLEYAHTELRSGNFEEAARLAGELAGVSEGPARGAALAVQGTALHEMGLALLADGDSANGAARLREAKSALAEVLKEHPDLDPLGSMEGRHAGISSRLKRL